MKKAAKPKRRNPGPAPEVLKIEGDWKDAKRKLISKKRPTGHWPNPKRRKLTESVRMKRKCKLASCRRFTGPGLQGLCGQHNSWMLHWALGSPQCRCQGCEQVRETTPEKRESIQFEIPKKHRSQRGRERAKQIATLSQREKELDLSWLKDL